MFECSLLFRVSYLLKVAISRSKDTSPKKQPEPEQNVFLSRALPQGLLYFSYGDSALCHMSMSATRRAFDHSLTTIKQEPDRMERNVCGICQRTDLEEIRPIVRFGVTGSAHWDCKLESMTDVERQGFLRSLPPWRLSQAPWQLLSELELFDFADSLIRGRL